MIAKQITLGLAEGWRIEKQPVRTSHTEGLEAVEYGHICTYMYVYPQLSLCGESGKGPV